MLVLSATMGLTYIGVGIYGIYSGDYLPGEWASVPFVIGVSGLVIVLCLQEIDLARTLDGLDWQDALLGRRKLVLLCSAAAIQIAIPILLLLSYLAVIFGEIKWLPGLVGVVTLICLPLTMWLLSAGSSRARQGDLLWVITIAQEQGVSLADEIERYGESVTGAYALQVAELVQDLRDGVELSDALENLPDLLPKHVTVAARVGENSGDLGAALRESALHHTSELSESNSNLSLTLFATYHALMELVASFLVIFIVPKFKHIFNDFGIQLPPASVALIEASDLLVQHAVASAFIM